MNNVELKEVNYEQFIDLLDTINETNEDIIKILYLLIPNMSSLNMIELNNIIESYKNKKEDTEVLFNNFKNNNPDLLLSFNMDPDDVVEKKYWEISLKSVEEIYNNAFNILKRNNFIDKSKFQINSQVYNAKNLSCLKNIKNPSSYAMRRQLYFKKYIETDNFNRKILKEIEDYLLKVIGNVKSLAAFMEYISNKKDNYISVFMDHFLIRMNSLVHDEKLENPLNKEFLENLKEIK